MERDELERLIEKYVKHEAVVNDELGLVAYRLGLVEEKTVKLMQDVESMYKQIGDIRERLIAIEDSVRFIMTNCHEEREYRGRLLYTIIGAIVGGIVLQIVLYAVR